MQIAMNFQVELLMGRLSLIWDLAMEEKITCILVLKKKKMLLISETLNGVKDFKVHWGK